jgi:membrane-associated protease RseP (regulator of RpoE activity)
VFLLEPQRTQFDLHFRVFRIPVRIHPMFWLISVIFGWSFLEDGLEYVLLWVGCMFASILLHELGHVWMGQAFGTSGHIVLYGFGGLAIGSNQLASPWKRIAVSFAGPFADFVLAAAAGVVLYAGGESLVPRMTEEPPLWFVLKILVWINLIWGLLNLAPIWPLDGGQISRDFLTAASPRNGLRISLGISFLVAAVLAAHCLMAMYHRPLFPFLPIGSWYSALFFALLALESFFMLQQVQQSFGGTPRRRHDPWD